MLAGCKRALALVEGVYDYALLKGLLSGVMSVVLESDGWRLYDTLRRCGGCLVVHTVNGIRNMGEKTVRLVLYRVKTLPGGNCLTAVVDSDEQEPRNRLELLWRRLDAVVKLYRAVDAAESGGGHFAYRCISPRRGVLPRLCIASWSCSAECWIASALPGCDAGMRRRCKACLHADAGGKIGLEEAARAVAEALESGGPAAGPLQGLRRRLLDP
ncbi:MAG: hypothetical protein GXO15_04700 [Crenarchaeota archaeon]|nr:hypothetical protein [Thermoproteota archaeon]